MDAAGLSRAALRTGEGDSHLLSSAPGRPQHKVTVSSEAVDPYRLRYEVFGECTGIRNGSSAALLGHGQRVFDPADAIPQIADLRLQAGDSDIQTQLHLFQEPNLRPEGDGQVKNASNENQVPDHVPILEVSPGLANGEEIPSWSVTPQYSVMRGSSFWPK